MALHDPLPLASTPDFSKGKHSRECDTVLRYLAQRWQRQDRRDDLAIESLAALNGLAAARTGEPLRPGAACRANAPSASQVSTLRGVRRRVRDAGCPPDLRAREAHQELFKTPDIYSEESRSTIESYDFECLKVLKGGVRLRDTLTFAPEHVCAVLREPGRFIERHSGELGGEPHVEPYWDPLLDPSRRSNRPRLLRLLRRLAEPGMVVATSRKKATVGFFFVKKKNNMLRMIVDGRQPNQYHRLPPRASMASVEALGALNVRAAWLSDDRVDIADEEEHMWGALVDLQDGFHQFLNPQLASWFVLNLCGVTAEELGVTEMYDDDLGEFVKLSPEQYVWPAYGGMAMGWSWALWVCHETLAAVMSDAASASDEWPLDKHPAPGLARSRVALAPYVDNTSFVGRQEVDVKGRLQRVCACLDELGLAWHELTEASIAIEVLGVVLDGKAPKVRRKPRAWRLYLGIGGQLRLKTAAGWQIRALLGHIVSFFQLMRPGLSCFRAAYDSYSEGDILAHRPLPSEVVSELRVVRGLIFQAEADLAAKGCPVAYMTDASMKGFALLETDIGESELFELVSHRERNRFRTAEEYADRGHDGFRGTLAGPSAQENWWDGVLHLPRHRSCAPAQDTEERENDVAPPPLPDSFVNPSRWELVVAGAWRHKGKIHEYEARGELMGLRRSASRPEHHSTVLLTANDNMGSVCAYEKGCATNLELLTLCRRAAAYQIGCSIQRRQRHVEGVRNVADYMSRAADRAV